MEPDGTGWNWKKTAAAAAATVHNHSCEIPQ